MIEKKILFIADHLKGGGAERILLSAAELLSTENTVKIALLDSNDRKMEVPEQVELIDLNINNKFMTGSLWRRGDRKLSQLESENLKILVESFCPDLIILTHWYAYHILPYIEGNIWCWVHGEIFNPKRKKTPNLFRWYKETRRIYFERKNFPKLFNGKNLIFVNKDLENDYSPYIPQSKTKVIYNGIRVDTLCTKHVSVKKQWDCIFVGRLSPEKQPDYALKAFSKSGLKGRMAIVGDGVMLNDLKKMAKELKVYDRVDFLGWQKNTYNFIKKSRVLIMSSKSEGFGLVIAESLCLGTPVVAFSCSDGVNYQMQSNSLQKGLVTPQDLNKLSEKINEICNNPYIITSKDTENLNITRMIEDFNKLL